ncbi:Pickpocket protein 28, partial [Gryllus bimaculatus]
VVLHSPAELPRPRQQAVMVPLDMEMQVGVRAREVRADAAVRGSYSAAQRRCFYPDERRLRFFRQYTQGNCELECLANATRAVCGCVEFHMPRDLDTYICGAEKINCCTEVASHVQALSANFNGGNFEVKNLNGTIQNCICFPICSYLYYDDGRTSLSDFDISSYQIMHNTSSNDTHYVRVTIYFKSSKYIPMRRVEHYKTLTLIANCGGILGLCLGMSILSIIELIYWLLIRPWTSHRKPPVTPLLGAKSLRASKPMSTIYMY